MLSQLLLSRNSSLTSSSLPPSLSTSQPYWLSFCFLNNPGLNLLPRATLSPSTFNGICPCQSGAREERQGMLSWEREEAYQRQGNTAASSHGRLSAPWARPQGTGEQRRNPWTSLPWGSHSCQVSCCLSLARSREASGLGVQGCSHRAQLLRAQRRLGGGGGRGMESRSGEETENPAQLCVAFVVLISPSEIVSFLWLAHCLLAFFSTRMSAPQGQGPFSLRKASLALSKVAGPRAGAR